MAIQARSFDFSGVKDRSQFNPKQLAEGDYLATVTLVEETESKEKKETMWVFGITPNDHRSITYPYYCNIENVGQLWKLRNLFIAAGVAVPKGRAKLNPNKVVGKQLGISLADDEYDGKMKSVIDSLMPASELADYAEVAPNEGEDEDEFEEEEVVEAPKAKRKAKPAPVEEEDDVEEDDVEEVEEAPAKPVRKAKAKPVVEEEEDDLEFDD